MLNPTPIRRMTPSDGPPLPPWSDAQPPSDAQQPSEAPPPGDQPSPGRDALHMLDDPVKLPQFVGEQANPDLELGKYGLRSCRPTGACQSLGSLGKEFSAGLKKGFGIIPLGHRWDHVR
jgi:hypothetical protein